MKNKRRKWHVGLLIWGVCVLFFSTSVVAQEVRETTTEGSVGFHGRYIHDCELDNDSSPSGPIKNPINTAKPPLRGKFPNTGTLVRQWHWFLGLLLVILTMLCWKEKEKTKKGEEIL